MSTQDIDRSIKILKNIKNSVETSSEPPVEIARQIDRVIKLLKSEQ